MDTKISGQQFRDLCKSAMNFNDAALDAMAELSDQIEQRGTWVLISTPHLIEDTQPLSTWHPSRNNILSFDLIPGITSGERLAIDARAISSAHTGSERFRWLVDKKQHKPIVTFPFAFHLNRMRCRAGIGLSDMYSDPSFSSQKSEAEKKGAYTLRSGEYNWLLQHVLSAMYHGISSASPYPSEELSCPTREHAVPGIWVGKQMITEAFAANERFRSFDPLHIEKWFAEMAARQTEEPVTLLAADV